MRRGRLRRVRIVRIVGIVRIVRASDEPAIGGSASELLLQVGVLRMPAHTPLPHFARARGIALLEQVAEERQKEDWLRPLASGAIRSCFMMTEPAPGSGSDPSMLLTAARRDTAGNRGDFVIDGQKWLITGAVGVSGMQSAQDSQVAEAGLGAFRPA